MLDEAGLPGAGRASVMRLNAALLLALLPSVAGAHAPPAAREQARADLANAIRRRAAGAVARSATSAPWRTSPVLSRRSATPTRACARSPSARCGTSGAARATLRSTCSSSVARADGTAATRRPPSRTFTQRHPAQARLRGGLEQARDHLLPDRRVRRSRSRTATRSSSATRSTSAPAGYGQIYLALDQPD